jgi:hypothetical protein
MDPKVTTEQKHVIANSPGQRKEIVTERTERGTEKAGLSSGTIALITVLALVLSCISPS